MVKHPFMHRVYGWLYGSGPEPEVAPAPPPSVDASAYSAPAARLGWHHGEKFQGGFGATELLLTDYWTLRQRSTQLFKTNLYARGLIRRLVTNVINTGLALEAVPDAAIIGQGEDALAVWAETVENRFHLWERTPALCDHMGQQAFGALQKSAKMAALISGDVLVVLLQDPITGLPRVKLVDGQRVQSPMGLAGGGSDPKLPQGHTIKHGVELDAQRRHVAYWVTTIDDATGQPRSERLPRVGTSTGRRVAWLVYGSDKMLDEVRGEPMLSVVLQSLREVDRYRDAVQRKAALNAVLAMFVTKAEEGPGTRPIMGGAVRKGKEQAPAQTAGNTKAYNYSEFVPGMILDELAPGEEPKGFPPTGTDEKFGDFESAIIYGIAWAHEIPPEILTLSFASNYSASQAAINEFKLFLNTVRADWGDDFCQPIYVDWLLSETLAGRVKAAGLLDAWRDPLLFDRYAAWTLADWSGAIKPSVDMVKQANAYEKLVQQGFISRDRATREITGQKYSKNVAKLARENAELAKANEPLAPPEPVIAPPGGGAAPPKPPARKPAGHLALVTETES
jgi:lambda family phage portal protein